LAVIENPTPPVPDAPVDARRVLFSISLTIVRAMTGKSDASTRTLLGKWAKRCGDNVAVLNAVIAEAADLRPAEPVAWIDRALSTRLGTGFRALEQRIDPRGEVDLDEDLRAYIAEKSR